MKIIISVFVLAGHAAADSCTNVCDFYSSNRLGNGGDLCEGRNSTCNEAQNVCEYLYWSTTEDGSRGLIYSVDGTELLPEELENPLTCDDAFELEDISAISTGLNLYAHFPRITEILNNEGLVASAVVSGVLGAQVFNVLRQASLGNLTSELVHAYRRAMGATLIDTVVGTVEQVNSLLRAFINEVGHAGLILNFPSQTITMDETLRCSVCGNRSPLENYLDHNNAIMVSLPSGSDRNSMDVVTIEQALGWTFNHGRVTIQHCGTCQINRRTEHEPRLHSTNDLFVIGFNRLDPRTYAWSQSNIRFGGSLDLSVFPGGDRLEQPMYQLIAVVHRNHDGTTFAEIIHQDRWYISNTDGVMERMRTDPERSYRTVSFLIYRRMPANQATRPPYIGR